METNLLFYKIQKGTIITHDYIDWSHSLLSNERSSPSVNIISSCSSFDNIFEIESYFKQSLKELAIKQPTFEACARAYIIFLAKKIIENEDHKQIFHLVDRIFKVVVVELASPDDLLPWIEICELMDRINYNDDRDVISKIKSEAKLLLDTNH